MSHERPYTIQVEEAILLMENFLSAREIVDLTGLSPSRVSTALDWLQKCLVIDSISAPTGEPFWFLTGIDMRKRKETVPRAEHTRSDKGGRRMAKRKKLYFKEKSCETNSPQ